MHTVPLRPPRVLLGNLEPMVRVGMSRLLLESGAEVAEEPEAEEVAARAAALAPDAIVLPLVDGSPPAGLGRARAAAPLAKLILWSRDESEMRIYDAGRTEPRLAAGTPDALLSELENK